MANHNSTSSSSGSKNAVLARARALYQQQGALLDAIEKSDRDPTPEELAFLNEMNINGHRATASFGGVKGSKKNSARQAFVNVYNQTQ